ncbi:MAG TPA: transporter substrate-binding domain-containing protein [Candidatus Acidoferrales bacterium]|nr:transporter substrate-binding domain-containing protein [Candidatus Acidoferrales bacterium]
MSLTALPACPACAGTILDKVRAAGSLTCGIDTEQPEYTLDDAHGNHGAFDLDLCKAVAAAVLGENAKLVVKPYRDEADSLKALAAGEIDVLATASVNIRTANGSFALARTVFYDHQGLLVNKTTGIRSLADLKGKKICVLVGTEIERQLTAYMQREKISFIPGPFSEEGEMEAAFVTRNCAAVSADVSQLAYERIAFRSMAQNFEILPEIVAEDPLAPAVRTGDPQWAAIVDWTMQALIQAEESGVTQANVKAMKASGDMLVERLLGVQKGYGQFLSLDDDWAARAIEAVGNYGEIFDRDLGSASPMKLDRGLNKLWTQGGLIYADPMR